MGPRGLQLRGARKYTFAMSDVARLILPDLREILARGDDERAREAAAAVHPADLAELVPELSEAETAILFRALDPGSRADLFEHLEPEEQEALVERLGAEVLAGALDEMSSDDRADLFVHLPEETRENLFPLLARAERNDVRRLLEFPEGTAGAIMSTEYAAVRPSMTVAEALDHLRRVAPKSETVYTVFVTGDEGKLVGVASLLDLITTPVSRRVDEIMREQVVSLPVDADQEEVARTVARYDFLALPIVDAAGRLVGIVTHDDVIDVLEEEHEEDVQLAAAIGPTETPYTKATIGLLVRKRVPWLLVLLLAGFLSSTVISAFEEALAATVALAFFIPVLIDSGGNTGSQSATLVIRGLATGDLNMGEWARVASKEILVGLGLGAVLAAAVTVWGLFWPAAREVAPVVGLTMFALVLWANLVGALMPLLLRRLGIDPAVASAPLITTLVDATGLLLYFTIATLLLLG
jgi:magnesium transporter